MGKLLRKQLAIAFASVLSFTSLLFSSCQEEDLGFTQAEVAKSKYVNNFVSEFGKPAAGHQWGFDAAAEAMGLGTTTRAVYKQEDFIDGVRAYQLYGRPADITELEHKEVTAWFTKHKVNWANTPAYFNDSTDVSNHRTNATTDGKAHVLMVKDGEGKPTTKIDTIGFGSLGDYDNPIGDYEINGVSLNFFNGWVQHVSRDTLVDEHAYDGNVYSAAQMDYLYFLALGKSTHGQHMKDFNSANGYGYGNKSQYNGGLVLESDFNVCAYKCSASGGTLHDKYYVVYLRGKDYAGYYLGIDFEADCQGANPNQRVPGDGICNDWIIKIVDVGNTAYNPARIMCEDLGGSFDTDFNDVVFDVQYKDKVCKVTLQAVGGTKEVEIWYGERGTTDAYGNESKKLTYNDGKSEAHAMFGANVDQPVNVGASNGVDGKEAITWHLAFEDVARQSGNSYWDSDLGKSFPFDARFTKGCFNFQDINIYVRDKGAAEWVNLTRLAETSNIPLRLCVPVTTKWCREMKSIKNAYTQFMDWVQEPNIHFWEPTPTAEEAALRY